MDRWINGEYQTNVLKLLGQYNLHPEEIYKAMESKDLSDVVMCCFEMFRKNTITAMGLTATEKKYKSEEQSNKYRVSGNKAFSDGEFEMALKFYNKALVYAPGKTRALKLAYGNRSALLFNANQITATLKDIETCFSLGCPEDIIDKLLRRKRECSARLWQEKMEDAIFSSTYAEEYFSLNVERNPQIPCASSSVGVILEADIPKVVAVKNMKVGTLCAVETSFVSETNTQYLYSSCYYCHKMTLNLIPCEKCCYAMFCDVNCKNQCNKEYHSIECQVIDISHNLDGIGFTTMGLKAAIKMKLSCENWDEFVIATKVVGRDRIKKSSNNEIYGETSKFSMLNYDDEQYLRYGHVFNNAFHTMKVLDSLERETSFFPEDSKKKQEAMRAVSRVIMGLALYHPNTMMLHVFRAHHEKGEFFLRTINYPNRGWFAFAGKLKHSCDPNLRIVPFNKQIALVAVKPIKKGQELTISYVLHWTDLILLDRSLVLYREFNNFCSCKLCKENWKGPGVSVKNQLNDTQKASLCSLKSLEVSITDPSSAKKYEKHICRTLALMVDHPNSMEYLELLSLFKRCLFLYQYAVTKSVVLGNPEFSP